jgi:hypothetical protein
MFTVRLYYLKEDVVTQDAQVLTLAFDVLRHVKYIHRAPHGCVLMSVRLLQQLQVQFQGHRKCFETGGCTVAEQNQGKQVMGILSFICLLVILMLKSRYVYVFANY